MYLHPVIPDNVCIVAGGVAVDSALMTWDMEGTWLMRQTWDKVGTSELLYYGTWMGHDLQAKDGIWMGLVFASKDGTWMGYQIKRFISSKNVLDGVRNVFEI